MRNHYSIKIHSTHGQVINPLSIKIHRQFNQLDKIELTALCLKNIKITRLLFNKFEATITGHIKKKIWGYITSFNYHIKADSQDIIRLTIEPMSFKLDRDIKYRIYTNRNAADIIRSILNDNKIPYKMSLNESMLIRKNQTQYQESSLNFIQRLCAENGLYFLIENTLKQQFLIIKDKLEPIHTVESPVILSKSITSEVNNHKISSNQIESHRYRPDNPLKLLHMLTETFSPHRTLPLCHYHYPHNASTHRETEIDSYIKLNQLKAKHQHWNITSREEALDLGIKVQTSEFSTILKVIELTQQYTFNQPNSDNIITHKNTFSNSIIAIDNDIKHTHFTDYQTPTILGLQTATIVTEQDKHSSTNETQERISFFWSSHQSRWVRVAQTQAGDQHGIQHTPLKNSLSVIQFAHNDPNTPMSLGQLYTSSKSNPHKKISKLRSGIQTQLETNKSINNHCITLTDHKENPAMTLTSGADRQDTIQQDFLQKTNNHFHDVKTGNLINNIETGYSIISANSIRISCGNSQITLSPTGIDINSKSICLPSSNSTLYPVARLGDNHSCPKYIDGIIPHKGGKISSGSKNVFINNRPAARQQDILNCHLSKSTIKNGNDRVLINDKPLARKSDQSDHNGTIITGSNDVSA